jgi:hypothetical protein
MQAIVSYSLRGFRQVMLRTGLPRTRHRDHLSGDVFPSSNVGVHTISFHRIHMREMRKLQLTLQICCLRTTHVVGDWVHLNGRV